MTTKSSKSSKETQLKRIEVYQTKFKDMFQEFNTGIGTYHDKIARNILNTFQDEMVKLRNDVAIVKDDAIKENME